MVENYEYELPADFEDEEINEDAAFNEEDEKLYGDWFASRDGGKDSREAEPDLLESEDGSDEAEEEYNTGDFSEEVSSALHTAYRAQCQSACSSAEGQVPAAIGSVEQKYLTKHWCKLHGMTAPPVRGMVIEANTMSLTTVNDGHRRLLMVRKRRSAFRSRPSAAHCGKMGLMQSQRMRRI